MESKKQTRDSLSRHTISDGTVDHLLDETSPPSSKLQSTSETPHGVSGWPQDMVLAR